MRFKKIILDLRVEYKRYHTSHKASCQEVNIREIITELA